MGKNSMVILFCLLAAPFFGCAKTDTYVSTAKTEIAQQDTEGGSTDDPVSEGMTDQQVYVYVCGHVNCPGVYPLPQNARICDALAMAGGVLDDGAGEALNQAERVTDGQTLYVPGKQEMAERIQSSTEDGLIDINAAGKGDFMTLPGIGESKAEAIVSYRDAHGSFGKIEDLMNIPGIKEGVFQKIKPYIKV